MNMTPHILGVATLLLVACDLGKTNLGELPDSTDSTDDGGATDSTDEGGSADSTDDGATAACEPAWTVTPPIRDGAQTVASAVLGLEDGFVLGGAPTAAAVTRVDASGDQLWSTPLREAPTYITDLAITPSGGYVAVAQSMSLTSASGEQLLVGAFSAEGELLWETELGSAHYMALMHGDVLVHPDGGYVVSWDDSQENGNDPDLALARLDVDGAPLWSIRYPLAPDSPAAINWAQAAMTLLGDGSILQLTSNGEHLRLVRTDIDGGLISDALVGDVVAWPKDVQALPDGGVLVLANNLDDVLLLEVDPGGVVSTTHTYVGGGGSFADAIMWDPTQDALLIAGEARDATLGYSRPWTLVVDRQGNELHNAIDEQVPGGVSGARDVATLPSGGFVVSRHSGALIYETVVPCIPQ